MGFPYTEVSPVLRSLQSSPVSVPLYNNLWLTSLSPCVCVCVCVCSGLHQALCFGVGLPVKWATGSFNPTSPNPNKPYEALPHC